MVRNIRVVQYGCGVIGCNIVRLLSKKPNIEIVGAIDIANVGIDLGEVARINRKLGVLISNDVDDVLDNTKPDIVLHATGSILKDIYPQLEEVIRAGVHVISTNEELSYPFRKQPELASAIDKLAREHQVTVLASGVNPGFVMDSWPLFMTGVCKKVKRIRVVRIQNASERRFSFQKKIGAGCTLEEFNKLLNTGTIRHVGLEESVGMIADGLGWEIERIAEDLEPMIAETEAGSKVLRVRVGEVVGIKQVCHGFKNGEEVITLDFQAYIGAKEPYDAISITGIPRIEVMVKGGINGDIATGAMIVNAIHRVIEASPGLITMKDLPIVSAR